jgi:ABC-2 type transport system permease protein
MRPLRLIATFIRVSFQADLAYPANYWISLLNSLLNLGTGVLGMAVLFSQVDTLRGWDFTSALALVGVYLMVSAPRGLFIGPGLETLAGLGQEIITGNFDFVLLRPVNTQFLVTFRQWRLLALVDLALGIGVIVAAVLRAPGPVSAANLLAFFVALMISLVVLYAVLLALTAMVFRNPGLLLTWVFDAVFQLARYPAVIYPGWLRFALTWIIPVGLMTTVPAQALTGQASPGLLLGSMAFAGALLVAASWLFQRGMRFYTSASS